MDTDTPRLRRHLRASGLSEDEVRRMIGTGAVTAVRRDAYVRSGDERLTDPVARHGLLIRAALEHLGSAAVVSHVSAAVLHGLSLWSVRLDRVHVSRDRRSGGRAGRRVHVHVTPIDADEVVEVVGIPVTTPARTVIDLARSLPHEQAVVIADGALGRRLVHPGALDEALLRSARWPGGPAARRVLTVADGRSESVGESRSRVAILRAGLPDPVLQWPVRAEEGRLVGLVDFGWPSLRAVGEFDGRVKYGRLLRPGEAAGDAVFTEKVREDDVRAQRLSMVCWTWPDLTHFEPVANRLRQAFAGY